MANFESIYNELDIGKARSQLADLGWVTLGRMDPISSVVKMRSEIDRLALDDDTEVNYGGSEHRIWKAHTKSEQIESFRVFSDQVLSEVEGQPFEAYDILAIRNRPIDLEDDGVTRGRWHLDSFNRQLKIFMFLTDVNDESGPFEMLPETHKMPFKVKEAIKGTFYRYRISWAKRAPIRSLTRKSCARLWMVVLPERPSLSPLAPFVLSTRLAYTGLAHANRVCGTRLLRTIGKVPGRSARHIRARAASERAGFRVEGAGC